MENCIELRRVLRGFISLTVGASIAIAIGGPPAVGTESGSRAGSFQFFDVPGAGKDAGQGTSPTSINDNGEITGNYKDAESVLHGFVRHKDGTFSKFDASGATKGAGLGTSPLSINNAGEIVGFFVSGANKARHGFIRRADGSVVSFDAPGSVSTVAQSISGASELIGNFVSNDIAHAFIGHSDGTFAPFDPPESVNTAPESINDRGEIAGYLQDGRGALHGFVRHNDGTFLTFDAPGASAREGKGTCPMWINSTGDIAGYYHSGVYDSLHGFLRRSDGKFVSFDPPGAAKDSEIRKDQEGFIIRPTTAPMGISETGEIAGYFSDATGVMHGFLRHKDGTFVTFEAPGASKTGDLGTFPKALNRSGQIVGYFHTGNASLRGFVFRPAPAATKNTSAGAPKK